jgi:tetratricopeptide (TPR) repeat protein
MTKANFMTIQLLSFCLALLIGCQHATAAVQGKYDKWETLLSSAIVSIELGHYDDAEKDLQMALECTGLQSPRRAITLQLLAELYETGDKLAEAEQTLLDYLDMVRQDTYFAPHRQAETLIQLGAISSRKMDYIKAEGYIRSALPIIKTTCGVSSPEYAIALNNLGWVEYHQNKLQEAEKHVLESLKIITVAIGASNTIYGLTVYNLGDIYIKSQRKQKALECYEKALKTFVHSFGKDDEMSKGLARLCDSLRAELHPKSGKRQQKSAPKQPNNQRVHGQSACAESEALPGVCFSDWDMAG